MIKRLKQKFEKIKKKEIDKSYITHTKLGIFQSEKKNGSFVLWSMFACVLLFIALFFDAETILDSNYYGNGAGFFRMLASSSTGFKILKTLFAICLIISLYFTCFWTSKLVYKEEILIADENGITDKTGILSFGFISWTDIDAIESREFMNVKFVELRIKDEKKYLKKINWLKRAIIKMNKIMGHEIVCMSLNSTSYDEEYITKKLYNLFIKYRNKQK